jgi:hypothetical protein
LRRVKNIVLEKKNEDEICTSSISPSTIPLTSGIEEAPQLLLSVDLFLPHPAPVWQAPLLKNLAGTFSTGKNRKQTGQLRGTHSQFLR